MKGWLAVIFFYVSVFLLFPRGQGRSFKSCENNMTNGLLSLGQFGQEIHKENLHFQKAVSYIFIHFLIAISKGYSCYRFLIIQ